jgi:hypothetical protein
MHNFIIEDGYNTSYMDSLFMGLFYTPSLIENILLNTIPKKIDNIYLQEIIKDKFVDIIKNGKSVLFDSINEIRNIFFMYGWLDYDMICNNQSVNNFYNFIAEMFILPIKIQKKYNTNNDTLSDYNNIYCININLDEKSENMISLKDIYIKWLEHEQLMIINIPHILPFYINRNNNKNKINILRRIKLDPTDDDNTLDWIFHSAICLKDDHYYTLLQNCGKWFIYDNNNIPCINEIKMNDTELINKIMTEVVMIFYVYNQ